jgi:UDP-glucose 4-epimerase
LRVLVTGGTGYIGSHTVVELQQQGYEVIIIDNLSNSYIEVVDSIQKITGIKPGFEKLDLCDKKALGEFFKKNKDINAVIHFAAYKSVRESVSEPLKYYENNIGSLINILYYMKEYKINNLVYSSSCTVYGQPDKLPVSEDSPTQKPFSPYGNTKKICEDIIHDTVETLHATSLYKVIALRYFNPIGAHASALIGELPIGIPNNLVPYITQTAVGKREFLNVFGNDYDTPDGTAIRDYIHVVDIAKAHIAALQKLQNSSVQRPASSFKFYNLGTGRGYSVLEVINAFEKVSGVKLKYKFADRRAGDIVKIWADTSLSNKELSWKAQESLESMMLSAWNWEKHLTLNT